MGISAIDFAGASVIPLQQRKYSLRVTFIWCWNLGWCARILFLWGVIILLATDELWVHKLTVLRAIRGFEYHSGDEYSLFVVEFNLCKDFNSEFFKPNPFLIEKGKVFNSTVIYVWAGTITTNVRFKNYF